MGTTEEDIDKKEEEMLLVVVAHAVVDPWTVVIHPGDAPLANRAVMTLGHLNRKAFLAFLSHHLLSLDQGLWG